MPGDALGMQMRLPDGLPRVRNGGNRAYHPWRWTSLLSGGRKRSGRGLNQVGKPTSFEGPLCCPSYPSGQSKSVRLLHQALGPGLGKENDGRPLARLRTPCRRLADADSLSHMIFRHLAVIVPVGSVQSSVPPSQPVGSPPEMIGTGSKGRFEATQAAGGT
jgi:hypothetical protein